MAAKNTGELFKQIQKLIDKSLKQDVAPKIVKLAQDHVQTDVYDVYTPKQYNRTGELKESFEVNQLENGFEVVNTRSDVGEDGETRYVPEVIEYGHDKSSQGYEYAKYYPGEENYIQPRPFIQNTKEEISKSNLHVNELKKSLKKQGIDVK